MSTAPRYGNLPGPRTLLNPGGFDNHQTFLPERKPKNDGNDSDSDEEEEKLFNKNNRETEETIKAPEAPPTTTALEEKKLEKEAGELAGRRTEPERTEEEKRQAQRSEEVEIDDNGSEESDFEPQNCDLVLGQYEDVQRTKNKAGRKYKCKLIKAVLRVDQKDYIAAKVSAEIEY